MGKNNENHAEKVEEYKKYIQEHKGNVKKIWDDYCENNKSDPFVWNDYDYHALNHAINTHDDSKLESFEFHGYRQWFFTSNTDTKNEDRFKSAWNHHQKNNPHHWEYWVLVPTLEPLHMPVFFTFEMLVDWSAMSLKFKDLPSVFYAKNKEKMILHKKTISDIEDYLPCFDACVKRIQSKGGE